MIHLTPGQSRAAALALLALVLVMVVLAVSTPLWLLNQRYEIAIQESRAKLERYSKIAGMREGLQQKMLEVKALGAARHYLKSASPALAGAELQELVKTVLDAHGAKLTSIQILPHKDEGLYRQITVNLQLTAPSSTLKPIFHALESARPYLFIDNLSIRAPLAFAPRNMPASEPELTVQLDLTGYALKGTP